MYLIKILRNHICYENVVTIIVDNLFYKIAPFMSTREKMSNIDKIRMQI